jgi:hypothetical protein
MQWSVQATGWSLFGLGRAATVVAGPALVLGAVGGRRMRRAAVALSMVPAAVEWWRRRPDLDLVRWSLASVADDVAYGMGVWAGCIRAGTLAPLLPAVEVKRPGRGGVGTT